MSIIENNDFRKMQQYYEMFNKSEDFNIVFYSINYPVPYKDLIIYPVKTLYYMVFHSFAQCFFVNKYDSGVAECMGFNPLQFLFYENAEKGISNAQQYLPLLEQLLLMCLQKEQYQEDGTPTIEFFKKEKKCFFRIEAKVYDWKDYENIRNIICEQNCIELPDYKIHPDIRKKLKEKEEILARVNHNKIASFEELIDCLMLVGHYEEDYILNLSIRRFTNLLKRYDIIKNYELMTILSPNMEKKDREKIASWISAMPKQDQYYSKITNITEIEKKVSGINNN